MNFLSKTRLLARPGEKTIRLHKAHDMLEKFGEFDSMGMELTDEHKVIFLDSTFWQKDDSVKGLSGKQLLRKIEDGIREIRSKTTVLCAIIFYDSTLRSEDGSDDPIDALTGRLEDREDGAYNVVIVYSLNDGHFKIESKQFIETEYHLLKD